MISVLFHTGGHCAKALRPLLSVFALIVLANCDVATDQELSGHNQPAPKGFFRVFADVRLKDTGELIQIDYVASCGAIVHSWEHTTSDVFFGMAPHIMLVPTGSGELIGVRTPEVCDNDYWTNWTEPDDYGPGSDSFLPLLMWYPDAANIGFAIGYLSDKAYESPYSKMQLIRSGIAKSNEAEWRAWREKAEAGYTQIGAMPGPWGYQMVMSAEPGLEPGGQGG